MFQNKGIFNIATLILILIVNLVGIVEDVSCELHHRSEE
jgi:hypothetical protein